MPKRLMQATVKGEVKIDDQGEKRKESGKWGAQVK